jgi:hypothetical protein
MDCEGTNIYKIDNNLYKCFDCGTLLINKDDLIKEYSDEIIDDNILFPKNWSEVKIIQWVKRRKYYE